MALGLGAISSSAISALRSTISGDTTIDGFAAPAVLSAYLTNYVAAILLAERQRNVIAIETSFRSFAVSPDASQSLYAATVPFITLATDSPANQQFDGTLEPTLRVDRSISAGGGVSQGYGGFSINISELSLVNADASYDGFASFVSINGQTITVRLGQFDENNVIIPYTQFELVAKLTAERFLVDRQHLTIEMRDPQLKLATTAVQQSVYAGTGDLEGSDEIAGKRRPFGDGIVFNATPALVLPNELLYQFNAGAVASIDAVKDGGAALTNAGDYGTVALLRAAALTVPSPISPGAYATCIADGYFVLGGSPFKQVTIDFTGLRTTTADIILNVAQTSAALANSEIDLGRFVALNTLQSAPIGYYLDAESSTTCAEMFTQLMGGIGGWHGMTPQGLLTVARFDAPDTVALASYNSSGAGLIDVDRTALPQTVDPPPRRWRVDYHRNYTVMTDLAGEIIEDAAASALLRAPHSVASTSAAALAAIVALYPNAPDPDSIAAFFSEQADAIAEAGRLYDLYSAGRQAFRFTLKNALFVHQIGDTVNITDSRLGLSAGRNLRLVAISDDSSRMISEMVGFG